MPLRNLIKINSTEFLWDENCEKALTELKPMIGGWPVLKRFGRSQEVTIQVNALSHGSGAVLMHNGKPVQYATKPITDTQRRYTRIEKELLAILFGCRKFHYYVYGGAVFTAHTDHKPLISIDSIKSPGLRCYEITDFIGYMNVVKIWLLLTHLAELIML